MPMPTTSTTRAATSRVARRAVHDRDMRVVAYELHTDTPRRSASSADAPDPQADLFLAGMVDVGLDRLASGRDVVVALPNALIREGGLAHLPLDRLVLDIPADRVVDDELELVLRAAREDGLRLRVADPVAHPHLASVAEVADVVAVAVGSLDPAARRRRLQALRQPGRTVLAAGVHDHDLHEDCLAAGYDLFSGTVLATPRVVSGRRLGTDRLAVLRLVALLDDPDTGVDALEAAVASNPALAYQVLRYVNSAFVGLRSEVDSVRRAVVLVGPPVLRQLAGLLLLQQTVDKPPEATRVALTRAQMCAVVGAALGDPRPAYHTVGLLSAVDLLTDVPLEEAVTDLPLTDEVVDALLHLDGRLGRVLQAVRLYERCDWDDPVLASFDPGLMAEAYLSALAWAEDVVAATREIT